MKLVYDNFFLSASTQFHKGDDLPGAVVKRCFWSSTGVCWLRTALIGGQPTAQGAETRSRKVDTFHNLAGGLNVVVNVWLLPGNRFAIHDVSEFALLHEL